MCDKKKPVRRAPGAWFDGFSANRMRRLVRMLALFGGEVWSQRSVAHIATAQKRGRMKRKEEKGREEEE
jgi:ribulose 1,5-bisphosphate synthetase/thiazole synthase